MNRRAEIARDDLLALRETTCRAVQSRKPEAVAEGLGVYVELARALVTRLQEYGVHYDRQAASKELSWPNPLWWREFDWIRDDYIRILEEAVRPADKGVLQKIMHFPVQLLQVSLETGDYLLWSHVIRHGPVRAYQLSEDIEDEGLRSFVVDRVWRHLKETSDFRIPGYLEKVRSDAAFSNIEEISEGILDTFNMLLKRTLDKRKPADFQAFERAFSEGFSSFFRGGRGVAVRGSHSTMARRQEAIRRRVGDCRAEIRLGLCAWLIRSGRVGDDPEGTDWEEAVDALDRYENLRALTTTFLSARSHEVQKMRGWDWWVIEENPEGEVARIDFDHSLDQAYVLLATRQLAQGESSDGSVDPFPELRHLVDGEEAPLWRAARDLKSSHETLLPDNFDGMLVRLAAILRRAVADQEKREEEQVVAAQLSDDKVAELQGNILDGYRQTDDITGYFRDGGVYRESDGIEEQAEPLAINTLLPKKFFVDVEGLSTVLGPLGYDLGREVASSVIRAALEDTPDSVRRECHPSDLWDNVENAVGQMKNDGLHPEVWVFQIDEVWDTLVDWSGFRPRGKQFVTKGPVGELGGARVEVIPGPRDFFAAVLDPTAWGEWVQLTPPFNEMSDLTRLGPLGFSMNAVTEEKANEWIRSDPDRFLLNPDSGELEEPEAASFRLQQRVHLIIAGAAHLRIQEPSAFRVFGVKDTSDPES